ncbi:hypothetical protein QQS21_002243 [Conoideocrella luteorostrata]|uniref:FAD dependent oxidoreductase domain-containing protein n=1 Tax=Conoideocrella luteorostrata TaxID=1105319 RepID=A0AAJ0CVE4_9HYPO|nr:hypothetical protein QQS21_002243 [Conoideocrella luteorostrata]
MATTVIVGTGIIGLSTAYYLSKHQPGTTIHLIDSSPDLFTSASGYAGGFLARTWHEHDPRVAALAALSFDEHSKLAEEEGGHDKWEYSKAESLIYTRTKDNTVEGDENWMAEGKSRAGLVKERQREPDEGKIPQWLKRVDGDAVGLIDDEGTAIVDPLKLCQFLLEKLISEGVQIHHPAIILSIGTDVRDELSYVRIGYTDSSTETEIPATRLLLSAGAWTPIVFKSLFKDSTFDIPISSLAGHSLVVKKPEDAKSTNYLIFSSFPDGPSLEFGTRPSGVVYFTGVNSALIPLPPLVAERKIIPESIEQLKGLAKEVLTLNEGQELEVVRTGLCFRPVTDKGTPYISRLADEQLGGGIRTRPGADGGVFVAAGHGPWGISMSLGTGLVMAELMGGKNTSVDITGLGLQQETYLPYGGDVLSFKG